MNTGAGYVHNHIKSSDSRSFPSQAQQVPVSSPGISVQQQQRLLYQQRLKQQQQQQLHFEQQIYQLLTTLNRKPKRLYQFKEDPDDLLKKYEQFKPSFEFHIYENNFKICAPANSRLQQHQKTPQNSNDGLILNKNNEILREFLEYVARGIIPEAIMEVLRDCNIQFYEGCLILQVYDHTNTVDVKQETPASATALNKTPQQNNANMGSLTGTPSNAAAAGSAAVKREYLANNRNGTDPSSVNNSTFNSVNNGIGNNKEKENPGKSFTTLKRPRMYRTLLRPNDLTHYYDMLSYADHTRFPDSMYQQLESEILTLTKRNLNLDTPMNPYANRDLVSDDEFLNPTFNEEKQNWEFPHRKLCTEPFTKGAIDHVELHEELPQHSSTYEQLMLILSEKTTNTTASTLAASLMKKVEASAARKAATSGKTSASPVGVNSNGVAAAAAAVGSGANADAQQFSRLKIIEHWRIEKERRKHQSVNSNMVPSAYNTRISMGNPMSPNRLAQQKGDNQSGNQGSASTTNKKTGVDGEEKPKAKRGRKATKKAADGSAPTPKKRATTKKKAAAAAAAAAAAGTPGST